jgi:hypothetical protein
VIEDLIGNMVEPPVLRVQRREEGGCQEQWQLAAAVPNTHGKTHAGHAHAMRADRLTDVDLLDFEGL